MNNIELPDNVKEWELTNPKAYELYKKAFLENRPVQIPIIEKMVEPIANRAAEMIHIQHQDAWKTFRWAGQQLDSPFDPNQMKALYDALYDKLDFEERKKLAYHTEQ